MPAALPFRVVAVLLILGSLPPAAAGADCERFRFAESSVTSEPGVELYVRSAGVGEPAVVVPGGFLLEDGLCALAERHRVIFYDMRNRGRSSPVTEGSRLTLEADIADLEAVRRHFDLDRMALVGYSYLGKMVVVYALENPERIARIVQLGPVPMDFFRSFPEHLAEPPLTASGAFDDVVREIRARRAEGLHESDPAAYCELEWALQRRGLVGDPAVAESLESDCDLPNEWPTRLAFHMQHHFLGSMVSAVVTPVEVATLHLPVLTLHGTLDRNAPYGGGREWAASLPGARLLTMEGMAHAMHEETDLVPILSTFLAGGWPDGVEVVEPAADGQRSQLQAWDLLRAAAEAHGAPADDTTNSLGADEALTMEWRGDLYARSQARTAEPPFEPPFPGRWRATLSADRQSLVFDEELRLPNFTSRVRSVVTPDDAFDLDLGSGAVWPPLRPPADLLARMVRRVPSMFLAEILDEAPAALRFAGVRRVDDRLVQAVSAVHRGERIDLFLDRDGRLAGWGRMTSEPMFGDAYETVLLAGTAEGAGAPLPRTIRQTVDGIGTAFELELVAATRDDRQAMPLDRPPTTSGEGEGATPPTPTSSRSPAEPRDLGSGAFLVPLPGAPDYASLVIERSDHLVLVEAPLGSRETDGLLAAIAERFPDKPIRWVVATHHHFDHAGGVPRALADGATLVTTPGNVAFFRRAVVGPHTIEPRHGIEGSAGASDPPTVQVVADTWSVPGGPPSVEILRVAANAHAAEMLAVHLPDSKLVFQGDLVRFPLEGEERPQVDALRRLLRERTPGVERVAGVHGEVGRAEELFGSGED